MYEHNSALGYWSGLALCLTKVRSSRARCPATALIDIPTLAMLQHVIILTQRNCFCFLGQSVPEDEQYDMRKSTMEETPNATPSTSMTSSLMGSLTNISEADKAAFEAEKMRVYQQLDDKVCETCRL